MPSRAYDLYPDVVRQFMATVKVTYRTSAARVAGDGTLTFFARGTRYRIPISELCRIYGFDESIASYTVPPFTHLDGFWDIVGTGVWDTNRAVLSDIRHPALRYFLRLLANTLVCKMEPNKVRIKELTLLFCTVNGMVDLVELDEDGEVSPPNLGAVFAAHLVELKKKPFTNKGKNKKETVGSLLTPIFQYLGIRLDSHSADRDHAFLDEQHLVHSLWLEEGKLWRFRIRDEHRLLPLPDRMITDFGNNVEQLRCMPDEAFLRNPRNMSRRPPSIRHTRAQDPQAPPLPNFPNIPDIPMHDQGDFQRFVVDALQAIWARVSCRSRRATGAQAPAPVARRDPSPEDDEATDEDTD
ncbi:uncharacterized protein LOC103848275 [Brassica rapa]|uniref:uncharacterized protein LOC103848275 n=1 Tax=Brassica campestris TaxID=3711 RepID=UPI00142DCC54|nr:uncharacterized protein LOC103848275 [Brassica rapa]XP_033144124.1 uncharacterized protein LOC103848275 [Brassica rapa]XP_033144125.1 uncharacterized protein LOC103848275 [Brassica rapa]